jgi:LysR family transcriptional activator of mexEF-oprN operon
MTPAYGRDLDLNLLRVFVVVAETGSATAAASRLYLTQPAISAALKRLSVAVGAPLFTREGRGISLTARGQALLAAAQPHLTALVHAALSPPAFDPKTSERTLRLGLSDASEQWLLPPLVDVFAREAPHMRLIVLPVQFRTVSEALAAQRVDVAVTVADELPVGVERSTLFLGSFLCLFDPRHAHIGKKLSLKSYLAHEHVIVSYNGDLRGVVEDLVGVTRSVRVSVPSFQSIGALVEGSALLATVPAMVAAEVCAARPRLRTATLPFEMHRTPMEMLWRSALRDDGAVRFLRDHIARLSLAAARDADLGAGRSRGAPSRPRSSPRAAR